MKSRATVAPVKESYEVGPFRLDPATSLLTLSGVPVALGRRAANVLTVLVRSPQQWISKAQLLESAWPGSVVEEGNLAVQIWSLRRALAQAPGGEGWIETLAGRGYRFVGPVQTVELLEVPQPSASPRADRNHSLPAEVDAFVGRAGVLGELASALNDRARVVSIHGTGGAGKTRLAQRFGWIHLSDFPGGVWFCDLSAAHDVDGIARAVARGLDVPVSGADPLAYLSRVISERGKCLVILDNFEQVARYAQETLVTWAEHAPQARFLVTTREVLGIPGEYAQTLGPLDIDDATVLFLQRAGEAEAQFSPTADDQPAIMQIAKLLDCLPLAIELAAARVRVLSPRSLLERMDHRFAILPTARGRAQRHATLRATFDWSWDLLEARERVALAQLSVFEGGFTVAAAEAILDLHPLENYASAIDLIQALIEKSLVRRQSDHRFGLLDTIRAFASERLETDPQCGGPEAARFAKARHYRFFATVDEADATAEQGVELDNLVVACQRAVLDEDAQSATGALKRAWEVLVRTGPHGVAVELTEAVQALRSLNDSQRAVVDWVAGTALFVLGRSAEVRLRLERGLAASRAAGDRRAESQLLRGLADQAAVEGRIEEALARGGEALVIAKALNDRSLECSALYCLGVALWRAGRLAAAKESYTKALMAAQEAGNRRMQAMLMGNLGIVSCDLGEWAEARSLYEQALRVALELGDRLGEAATRNNLADLSLERGDTDEAHAQLEAAMVIGRFLGHARTECVIRNGLGGVFAAKGDHARASEEYRHAVELAHEMGDRRAEGRILSKLGLSLACLGASADAKDRFAASEAVLSNAGDPASLAELYCRWAEGAVLSHSSPTAAQLVKRAEQAVLAVGSPSPGAGHLEAMLRHVRSLIAANGGVSGEDLHEPSMSITRGTERH
ncbi:MAG TPA: tetratricopeptide repeat protein [Casimicrobiaceae bacterium]|nr:tetratricopeptide repeat protein [Casimicrobiaceae bacterium]